MKSMLTQTWAQASVRERRAVGLGLTVLIAALAWALALAPAWRTLRSAPAQHSALTQDLQRLLTLQAQARALQARRAIDPAQARRALASATTALGSATLIQWQGERAVVKLQAVPAAALAGWLIALERDIRVAPTDLDLRRGAADTWSGQVLIDLPAAAR